jgi:hypothetical protein
MLGASLPHLRGVAPLWEGQHLHEVLVVPHQPVLEVLLLGPVLNLEPRRGKGGKEGAAKQ